MILAETDIPARFRNVPYNAARIPEPGVPPDVTGGANCQVFAYALLAHFGRNAPLLRSSELWADTAHTDAVAGDFAAFDLLLFNPHENAFGAHVAVSLGGERAIHLSQRVGRPAVWTLAQFAAEADYRVLIGAKRVR